MVMKDKLQSLGFTSGHAHLLLVAVAIFAVLTVAKSDISIKALFVNADEETKMLTYDEVRNKVAAEYGSMSATPADEEAERQLALLDRSLDQGQVLGEQIGIGSIPRAEQIFSRDQLDQIVVQTKSTSKESVQKYTEEVLRVESKYGAVALVANLNSNDPAVLNQTKDQAKVIIQNLKGLTVPSELADYHRYKMIYYQTLSNMADAFATNDLNSDFQNTSKIMFGIMEKIEQTNSQIQTKYQVNL